MSTAEYTEQDLRRLLQIDAVDVIDAGAMIERTAVPPRYGRSRRLLPLVAAAMTALLAGVAMLLHATRDASPAATRHPYVFDGAQQPPSLIPVGDRGAAVNVSGQLLAYGETFDLGVSARDQVTVLNFWGAWCGPCQVQTQRFQSAYEAYGAQHVAFVGVDIKELSQRLPRAFVAAHKITYPMIYDPRDRIAARLGDIPTAAVPITVLLDKDHRIAGVYLQHLALGDLKAMLDELVAAG